MKSFKEYYVESKKVYEFKVKIAGDQIKNAAEKIKVGLAPFKVENCSQGKSVPIQEFQADFPEHKNVGITMYDVSVSYPATKHQIRDTIAAHLGIGHSQVMVRSLAEEHEYDLNHKYDEISGEAVLNKHELEYEPGGQEMVGTKHAMSFLQELNKEKHAGEQYKGVNDKILASGAPTHTKDTPGKQSDVKTNVKNIFTKQVKITDPMKGAK